MSTRALTVLMRCLLLVALAACAALFVDYQTAGAGGFCGEVAVAATLDLDPLCAFVGGLFEGSLEEALYAGVPFFRIHHGSRLFLSGIG